MSLKHKTSDEVLQNNIAPKIEAEDNTNNKSHKIENNKIKQSKELKTTTKPNNQKNTNGSNERNQQQ